MDKRLIATLAVFLLVLSGCQGLKFGQSKDTVQADTTHIGFKGVTMSFVKNSPPDEIFTGSPLDVVLELKNEGATAVTGGTLYLSGYDTRMFTIQPQYDDFSLEAKTSFNTFGGYEALTFHSDNMELPQGTDVLPQTFLASACYQYRTEARIRVCVDPNPLSVLENEACNVRISPVVSGGQGAPIAVTAVKEDAAPGKVAFLITIANQGNGILIDKNSMDHCPSDLKFNDVDMVYYSVTMSGVVGECQPVQKVRLANKQGVLYCKFDLIDKTSSAYTSVLEVNLDYGYLSQLSKTVRIKSSIG